MKDLLIVFIKNPILGKVKTRLAEDIGEEKALEVYNQLLRKTLEVSKESNTDVKVYFSDQKDNSIWPEESSEIQSGSDLGEKMKNALQEGFESNYERICLIGSDLPDITLDLIKKAFQSLSFMDVVIGPAHDGGYYLIGMRKIFPEIFEDMTWSTSAVLEKTLERLTKNKESYFLLETKNDIDTKKDLDSSGMRY